MTECPAYEFRRIAEEAVENVTVFRSKESQVPEVKKVVFFSPFAFIWQHALAEFQLAQTLHESGMEVKAIGCRKSYDTLCTSMEAAGIDVSAPQPVKDGICKKCIRNSRQLVKSFRDIEFTPVEEYCAEIADQIETVVEAPKTPEEILNYTLEGIHVGRLALYETLIKFKKFDMELNLVERQHFEASFSNAVKTLWQATAALKAEKPDAVVCYSPQYVIPGIFAAVAARENIRVIFIEGSSNDVERYSHLRVWDWEVHGLNQPALKNPERFETFKLTDEGAARARRVMAARQNASAFSAYTNASKNADPFDVFGLDRSKKYVLIAMSSYDEVYSGYVIDKLPRARFEGRVFKNQLEWLQETIAWASGQPDIQLVVRPHPREFPNPREKIISPHVKLWSSILTSLPPNVKIDHPDLKFSLYDHLPHISALITGWSSVGVEALSQGIPVVTYDQELPTFPKSIHYSGTSKAEYFENILRASHDTDKERHIRNATRWLAYTFEVGTIKIGGRFDDRLKLFSQLKIRRFIRGNLARKLDVLLPPSGQDRNRAIDILQGKGTSLFDLPEHGKQ